MMITNQKVLPYGGTQAQTGRIPGSDHDPIQSSKIRFAHTSEAVYLAGKFEGHQSAEVGDTYVNTTTNLFHICLTAGSFTTVMTAATVTMDNAYDGGGSGLGRTTTVDSGAVRWNDATTGAANTLEVVKSGAGATGYGLSITTSATQGRGLSVSNANASTRALVVFSGAGVGSGVTGSASVLSVIQSTNDLGTTSDSVAAFYSNNVALTRGSVVRVGRDGPATHVDTMTTWDLRVGPYAATMLTEPAAGTANYYMVGIDATPYIVTGAGGALNLHLLDLQMDVSADPANQYRGININLGDSVTGQALVVTGGAAGRATPLVTFNSIGNGASLTPAGVLVTHAGAALAAEASVMKVTAATANNANSYLLHVAQGGASGSALLVETTAGATEATAHFAKNTLGSTGHIVQVTFGGAGGLVHTGDAINVAINSGSPLAQALVVTGAANNVAQALVDITTVGAGGSNIASALNIAHGTNALASGASLINLVTNVAANANGSGTLRIAPGSSATTGQSIYVDHTAAATVTGTGYYFRSISTGVAATGNAIDISHSTTDFAASDVSLVRVRGNAALTQGYLVHVVSTTNVTGATLLRVEAAASARTTSAVNITDAGTGAGGHAVSITTSGAFVGAMLNLTLGVSSTAGYMLIGTAAAAARSTALYQTADNGTGSGGVYYVTVDGAASGHVYRATVGTVLYTGALVHLALGATSVGGQGVVVTAGAAARTTTLVSVADAGTSYTDATGMSAQFGRTGALTFVTAGTHKTYDVLIAPSGFAITEPAGTGVYAALGVTFANITGVAGAGNVDACGIYINVGATIANLRATYAIFADTGLNRFDGDGTHVFELPADATDPTSGGGAATGRIPVTIGGATRYIPYY